MNYNTLSIYSTIKVFARLSNNNFCIRSNNRSTPLEIISYKEHNMTSKKYNLITTNGFIIFLYIKIAHSFRT